MPATIEEIKAYIDEVSLPGFRGRLLARGQARAIIWRDGVMPQGAPEFSPQLSYDLQSYGYSLLGQGLLLREMGGDSNHARRAFEQAATALESIIAKGDPNDQDRDFHFVIAAAAYHLAQLSARSYSLLTIIQGGDNFSPIEQALSHLMLRNLDQLETLVITSRLNGLRSDARIREALEAQWAETEIVDVPIEDSSSFLLDSVDLALTDNFFGAIAIFLLALERGESELNNRAIAKLKEGIAVCEDLNFVPQWWGHKVAIHLINGLWESSFHEKLPIIPIGGEAADWVRLRSLFISVLLRRGKAEIDLWPSQIDAAARAVDQTDDLVISLPTSAGKTRIAELCILRCLAAGKRVVFVTPLRALSAQTEITLQRTFAPLGKTISALYGSIGASGFDNDAIRERHIVVSTPEKLDFALRNDPSLLDDVGLLVFDEGHMIGLNEREVRYEVQIQRLLRRTDAQQRRIICLSAILPDGEQLDDFSNWLRRDQPGGVVKSEWRPTRLRYGEVMWNGQTARLNLRVGDERPFVPQFFSGFVPPVGNRRKLFPVDLGELCLATAWRLVADGHSVLVYCPVRRHVEPFADRIIDLHARGALSSLLVVDELILNTALALGQEWLGAEHPILQCLKLGVAIHHGALPSAFRKEVERLLREGILKVTISSPTLAQGLNLSATTVIIHSLFRNRERIETSEFKNVIGRAGRAFVDIEGLVLYPIYDNQVRRVKQWEELIADLSSREMESGLLRLVVTLLKRMHENLGKPPLPQLMEYVLNNADAWSFPELLNEEVAVREREERNWRGHLSSLDTALLSMLGEYDVADEAIAEALDEVLHSSLWERRLNRKSEEMQLLLKTGLLARSQYIWARSTTSGRRGYFLAGVGLDTGHALDAIATETNALLVSANAAILLGDQEAFIGTITAIAEKVFVIHPFIPDTIPHNWQEILRLWLQGLPLADIAVGQESETLQFVENGLVYRLPWAMEAIRVRGIANADVVGDMGLMLNDFELGVAVSAVETGTLSRSASILIQAGFNSRLAAVKVVADTHTLFTNGFGLQEWLTSDLVVAFEAQPDWPTTDTKDLWRSFSKSFLPRAAIIWTEQHILAPLTWQEGVDRHANLPVRIYHVNGQSIVLSSDALAIGSINAPLNPKRCGVLHATVTAGLNTVHLKYFGPDDLLLN